MSEATTVMPAPIGNQVLYCYKCATPAVCVAHRWKYRMIVARCDRHCQHHNPGRKCHPVALGIEEVTSDGE